MARPGVYGLRPYSLAFAVSLACAAPLAAACGHGVRADVGSDAWLQVQGGTFVRGEWPGDEGGPAVESVDLVNSSAVIGAVGRRLGGTLAPGAEMAAIRLAGDRGYWLVRAAPPGLEAPQSPVYTATFDLARTVEPGEYRVEVRATNLDGAFGPARSAPLTALPAGGTDGVLVFRLTWDRNADLDLHVLEPSGAEIFHRDKSSRPRGVPPSVDAGVPFGVLDADSNPRCAIDGRREENVVYRGAAPSGRFVVRVDTFGLCGEDSARWRVQAFQGGRVVAEQRGTAVFADTTYPHDRGAGVVALELDL